MTVSLKPLTKDNYRACFDLDVKADQKHFVASNLYSIAQGQFYPGTEMRAIYADETMVGFVMWNVKPSETWVWRLMIAGEQQGKGYGRAAMELVIAQLKSAGVPEVFLSYTPKNTGGALFYARLGFEDTGHVHDGEIVVKKDLTDH